MWGDIRLVHRASEIASLPSNPMTPSFWFVMSMGLLVGFIVAYPINWWLVTYHLKHGMTTVRPAAAALAAMAAPKPIIPVDVLLIVAINVIVAVYYLISGV